MYLDPPRLQSAIEHWRQQLEAMAPPDLPFATLFHGTSAARAASIAENGFALQPVRQPRDTRPVGGVYRGIYQTASQFALKAAAAWGAESGPVIVVAALASLEDRLIPDFTMYEDVTGDSRLQGAGVPSSWQVSLRDLGAVTHLGAPSTKDLLVLTPGVTGLWPLSEWARKTAAVQVPVETFGGPAM